MALNATTSLPLPRTDPDAVRTTVGSDATALPDTATAAHATQASLSIQRMAIHRPALELLTAAPITVMCFPESSARYSLSSDRIYVEVYSGDVTIAGFVTDAANDSREISTPRDVDNRYKRSSVAKRH